MDIIDRKNCPVCGTPVIIVSGEEGTNRYEPVYDKEKNAEIKRLQVLIREAIKRVDKKEGWTEWLIRAKREV